MPTGWRLSGNLPLEPGDICSLIVILPTNTPVSVSAAIVNTTVIELRNQNPRARIPETVFPSSYLLSQREEKVIDEVLTVLNQHGMDSQQSLELLEQIGRIIEMGARITRGTTH